VLVEATPQLDRVSEKATRERTQTPLKAFLSYSHADRKAKSIWLVNLAAMQGKELITSWHDGMIEPGAEWKKEIEAQLESMDIFIGLLTNHFVNSTFIKEVELKAARTRLKERGKRDFLFVLILVDDIPLEGLDHSQYQILKPAGKAVCKHKSRKDGFNEAQREIEKLVRGHMRKEDDEGFGKPGTATPPPTHSGGSTGVTVIHVKGDYVEGGKHMRDDRSVRVGGSVINSQVGQTLTNCTKMVNQQARGKKKDLLKKLRGDVEKLIEQLPEDKKAKVAANLETAIKQATEIEPDREWYDLSAKGLLEAATWVKDLSGEITGTIKNLGTMLWPDFSLPKLPR